MSEPANPYDRPSDPAKRNSAVMTDGPHRAAARAMLKAIGFTDDDLATLAPVARIATFMGVGGLMLVIGYLAPAPPELRRRRPSPAPDGAQRPAD